MTTWYLMRGAGAVTLLLLTMTVVLGVANQRRVGQPGGTRVVLEDVHRTISLLAVLMLAVHIITAIIDTHIEVSIVDTFLPFLSRYEPIWTGLGALALDMLVLLIVTSLIRAKLGLKIWRAVHWLAYACWPVAFAHSIGIGTDVGSGGWMLWLGLGCAAVLASAIGFRILGSPHSQWRSCAHPSSLKTTRGLRS